MSAVASLAARMSEAELMANVRQLCRLLGLRVYHTHDSRRSDPGFPDLVIVGGLGVLYRELKTERGRLRPEQREWLAALRTAGQNADVWRPGDWLSGEIGRQLRNAARPSTTAFSRTCGGDGCWCGCHVGGDPVIRPRTSCPECGRQTAASPPTGRLYPHEVNGQHCPGSGRRVDLYGTEVDC